MVQGGVLIRDGTVKVELNEYVTEEPKISGGQIAQSEPSHVGNGSNKGFVEYVIELIEEQTA